MSYLVQPTHKDGAYQKDMDLMVVKEEQLKYAPSIISSAIGSSSNSNNVGGSTFDSHDYSIKLQTEEKGVCFKFQERWENHFPLPSDQIWGK